MALHIFFQRLNIWIAARVIYLTLAKGCDNSVGICPVGNTFCPRWDGRTGCVPNDLGSGGVCCSDRETGCGHGYHCAYGKCVNREADPLVQILPRYHLCHVDSLELHGLPIHNDSGENPNTAVDDSNTIATATDIIPRLAYYSSHGDLWSIPIWARKKVKMVLIVIHGANRNADDYFCSGMAAVELHVRQRPELCLESIMVLAPCFLEINDSFVNSSSKNLMRWETSTSGAWRYGASPVMPPEADKFSSFDGLDHLVLILRNSTMFPSLENITVAGHSSGGQFVQRWALLTNSTFWEGHDKSVSMRAVVANPSSYAYLTALRFISRRWQLPIYDNCSLYNQWEWGLNSGGPLLVPYMKRALDQGREFLISRFLASRAVVYLVGSQDRCNVSGTDNGGNSSVWCQSHGLETTCMDVLQGTNRLERSRNYFESLKFFTHKLRHLHWIVEGVGHDHSLMFTSSTGQNALFQNLGSHTSLKKQELASRVPY